MTVTLSTHQLSSIQIKIPWSILDLRSLCSCASTWIRTMDRACIRRLLYQLSYTRNTSIIPQTDKCVNNCLICKYVLLVFKIQYPLSETSQTDTNELKKFFFLKLNTVCCENFFILFLLESFSVDESKRDSIEYISFLCDNCKCLLI